MKKDEATIVSAENATNLRTIAVEEHWATPRFLQGPGREYRDLTFPGLLDRLLDLADKRIHEMDSAGIDMQVLMLNSPGAEPLDAGQAAEFARETNDLLSEAIRQHPGRFAGYAVLPTAAPGLAADELERAVGKLGLRGAVINGHIQDRYLDDSFFWPILERAEALEVPIYVHPVRPPKPVVEVSFTGNFPAQSAHWLAIAGWGWHIETATHILRIILSGVFDRYPRLQFIVGHLGEGLPFFLERFDQVLRPNTTGLNRPVGDYLRQNLHYSFSGFNFVPAFLNLLLEVGTDRILFSCDYPYGSMAKARAFLDQIPVSPADRERIAHRNAEQLFGL
jgi:predicted TIM-barrel fold metal-dependent hydrolase